MKVELELKNGKRRSFHPAVAKVLVSRGMGKEVTQTYQTRMMTAQESTQWRQEYDKESPLSKEPDVSSDEVNAIRAELDKRGIKYHHRAGPAKLRELLGS